jgi:hypothetical protein
MATDNTEVQNYSLEEITKLLIKSSGLTEGYYLTLIIPSINGGQLKSKDGNSSKQGLVIEFDSVRLLKVDADTDNAVNAAAL